MYRDDVCAVCGESLPPDHVYCREHAADVDDRLHEIGALLPRVAADTARLARLLDQIAQETWDWLASREPGDPDWPPTPPLDLTADAEDVDVEVDTTPGMVRVGLQLQLAMVVDLAARATAQAEAFARACAGAEGANATH